jgi:hypothetical protein
VKAGDAVEFIGTEDPEHDLWLGLPGRIVDVGPGESDVSILFVNGPSLGMSMTQLAPLDESEYLRRGRRAVALLHPLRDQRIPRVIVEGQEWPEGSEPTS